MKLTDQERAMLDGREGPAVQKAMQMVVALGEIYEAEHLVSVSSVQVAGVSYKNLGDAGLQFLEEWLAQGAMTRVPAYMNPAGMDLDRWEEMGITSEFAENQLRIVNTLVAMGVESTCTCTPYLVGHVPQVGEHIAWSESSAVSYANSVLGARTNREGGPGALSSAIVGRTAAYGLHLSENRRPTHVIDVSCPLRHSADYAALGYVVGVAVKDGVPFFRTRVAGTRPTQESLMALGAAMAASGAVALYHVEGITPEASTYADQLGNLPRIAMRDLSEGYQALNVEESVVDFVSVGCPHSTLTDLQRVAELLDGKRVKATTWITTSRHLYDRANELGYMQRIERAGALVIADTCLVVAPVETLGFRVMATNSAKAAFYASGHSRLQRHFGTLEECMEAAVTGIWAAHSGECRG